MINFETFKQDNQGLRRCLMYLMSEMEYRHHYRRRLSLEIKMEDQLKEGDDPACVMETVKALSETRTKEKLWADVLINAQIAAKEVFDAFIKDCCPGWEPGKAEELIDASLGGGLDV